MLRMFVVMVGITFGTCDLLMEGMEIKHFDPASTAVDAVVQSLTVRDEDPKILIMIYAYV